MFSFKLYPELKYFSLHKHYLKHPQERFYIVQQAGIDAFDVIPTWYLLLAKATELNLIPNEFIISDFDKEMIKKGKLLEKSWNQEWDEYKKTERSLQNTFSKEEESKTKDILGF